MARAERVITIGNAGGYWGDDPGALRRQLEGPVRLDYVSVDFLAEPSMSILQKQRAKDPGLGYARDFLVQVGPVLRLLKQRGTRIVTNAGGVNPRGCAEALLAMAREQGIALRVAVVLGDDILGRIPELRAGGVRLDNMETGESFDAVAGTVAAANAYFGALPVARALALDPDVVLCGRVTDTGITLGPMMHELGWGPDDHDMLAAGIVAGHIIECGAQVTGGNFTDWRKVPSFAAMGYPILECHGDGSFVVTKQPGSGGLVTCATVREQLLYEMGRPDAYLTPDCVADFTTIRLEAIGHDRVRVSGVQGRAPTSTLKVSMAHSDGFKVSGSLIVSGPDARPKAEAFAAICWGRLRDELGRAGLPEPEDTLAEFVGHDSCHGGLASGCEPTEVLLRLSARGPDRRPLEVLRKVVPGLILGGPPGVAVTGGAAPISEVVGYWPCLIPREAAIPEVELVELRPGAVAAEVVLRSGPIPWPAVPGRPSAPRRAGAAVPVPPAVAGGPTVRVPLAALAHARSGDKGDTANIGLIARSPECYQWLRRHVTAARVKRAFVGIALGDVVRHEVANLWALNFLLGRALDGGGTRSLKLDAQGKTLAQALLRVHVTVPRVLLASIAPENVPARPGPGPRRSR